MSGAARTARISVIDEAVNPLDTRFAGGAFTDGVSDSYAALNAALQAAANTPKGRMVLPPYTFRISQGLVATTENFVLEGAGGRRSRIQLTAGVNADVLRVLGGGPGLSSRGRIVGVTFCTTSGSAPTNGKAGIALDAINKMHMQDVYVFGTDIGFDMRNNSYGTRFIGCATDPVLVQTGIVLRGATPAAPFTAGSGSDISFFDCWLAGKNAAVWMEPNAGGYHFSGGQLAGGSALASATDLYGSVLMGLGYDPLTTTTATVSPGAGTISVADATSTALFASGQLYIGGNWVTYTGRSGAAPGTITGVTGVTTTIPADTPIYNRGRVSNVEMRGVSFEGTTKRHCVRSHYIMDGLSLDECSFGVTGCISVLKCNEAGNSILKLSRSAVRGSFTSALPLDITGLSGSWDIQEEVPNVVSSVTFNGVTKNFQTKPMIEESGLGSRARAFFGDKVRFGGRTLRWNVAALESHTDSSASSGWLVISGGGSVQNLFVQATQPASAPSGSLWIPLDVNGDPVQPTQWQVFT